MISCSLDEAKLHLVRYAIDGSLKTLSQLSQVLKKRRIYFRSTIFFLYQNFLINNLKQHNKLLATSLYSAVPALREAFMK